MASKNLSPVTALVRKSSLSEQFRGLNRAPVWTWPPLPRYALLIVVAAVVVAVAWLFFIQSSKEDLERAQQDEQKLRTEFQDKARKAANLDELKKQKEQVTQYVSLLEKQLPSKAEMDVLLSDINQAGLGRSLQFEVFRPGKLVVREYYAELPIALKVTGRYHDIGAFVADIANLSRIVTLNNVAVAPQNGKDVNSGTLVLDATAKTFRYLDQDEIEAQRKATSTSGRQRRR